MSGELSHRKSVSRAYSEYEGVGLLLCAALPVITFSCLPVYRLTCVAPETEEKTPWRTLAAKLRVPNAALANLRSRFENLLGFVDQVAVGLL